MQCLTRQDTEQVEYVIRVRLKRYADANSCFYDIDRFCIEASSSDTNE